MVDLLFYVLVALIAGVIGTEYGLRLWFAWRKATFVWSPYAQIRLQIDQTVMPRFPKNALIAINRDGERGDAPPKSWESAYRILVIGGSAAECYSLDQNDTWPGLIQKRLRSQNTLQLLGVKTVHVGSVARSLFPAEAAARVLPEIGHRYKDRLDMIIIMLGASDMLRWLAHGTPADTSSYPVSTDAIFADYRYGPFGWKLRQLALYRGARYLNERFRRPVLVKQNVGRRVRLLRQMRAEARVMLNETPDPTPMLEAFGKGLQRLIEQARTSASHVVVIRQPWLQTHLSPEMEKKVVWNFAQGNPHAEKVEAYYTCEVARGIMEKIDEKVENICNDNNIYQINLRDKMKCDLDDFYDFFHFTPNGAERVAKITSDALVNLAKQNQSRFIA